VDRRLDAIELRYFPNFEKLNEDHRGNGDLWRGVRTGIVVGRFEKIQLNGRTDRLDDHKSIPYDANLGCQNRLLLGKLLSSLVVRG
jgi:hypothetical protein